MNALFFLGGLITAFGLIGVVNFVFVKYAMRMRDDNREMNDKLLAHYVRVEAIWDDIAKTLKGILDSHEV